MSVWVLPLLGLVRMLFDVALLLGLRMFCEVLSEVRWEHAHLALTMIKNVARDSQRSAGQSDKLWIECMKSKHLKPDDIKPAGCRI